jgi:hypothetical protein
MGLDMMAYAVDADFEETAKPNNETIAEWRKHPNLHGWMEKLYRSKGGTEESFNCVEVELTEADLDKLFEDVCFNRLPDTTGFFYGSNADDFYKQNDKFFVEDARAKIKAGKKVFYNSWW